MGSEIAGGTRVTYQNEPKLRKIIPGQILGGNPLRAVRSLFTIVDHHNTVLGRRNMEMRPLSSITYFDPPRKTVFGSIQVPHLINNGLYAMYIVFRQ